MKKIYFLKVTDITAKLNAICQTAYKHFSRREATLLLVPSQEAALYIDQLLWRQPDDSFLPHAIVNAPSQELVAITTSTVNLNQAQVLINLCPEIPGNVDYAIIYDLFDLTHPAKEQLSLARQSAYHQSGYHPEFV